VIVARDATAVLRAPGTDEARGWLGELMSTWREGMNAPLPMAPRTAIAVLQKQKDDAGRTVYERSDRIRGEGDEPCLARMYPDYEALTADGRFAQLANALFAPLLAWADDHVTMQVHAGASEENTESDEE